MGADGADEIDALLDDVPSACLNGVDRVIGASLIVKVVKTRGCRLRHILATVAGILKEDRTGGAERAMAPTNFGEEAGDNGKGGGRGKRGQASNPGSVKENDGGGWQLFFRIFEKWVREVFLPVVPCAQRAQLPLSPWKPARHVELPRVPEQGSIEPVSASLSTTAMLFLQHGGVNLAGRPLSSMAWSRALRAADSASHISPVKF